MESEYDVVLMDVQMPGMDDSLAKPFEPQKLRQKILKTTTDGNVA